MLAILTKLLAGSWIDPDTGAPVLLPIRALRIERGLGKNAAALLAGLEVGRKFCVVSDASTHAVLGASIEKQLPGCDSVILPGEVKPALDTATALEKRIAGCDAVVAIGSGTINDLCKYASARAGKPYAAFGTAASMNGYTSANASIIVEGGFRTSLPAQLPAGVFLDLDVLAAAPAHLTLSGLGDALCRSTCQADWLLSHLVLGTPYKAAPFALLAPYEEKLFELADGLAHGNQEALETLALTLALSGIGMWLCGGSYPASQGEHLIAHLMEMAHGATLPRTFHGQEIGITTLTMARMQNVILAPAFAGVNSAKEPMLLAGDPSAAPQDDIIRYFPPALAPSCITAYRKKLDAIGDVDALNDKLAHAWPSLRDRIRTVTVPEARLRAVLEAAGAPTTPQAIGWPQELYENAVLHARYTRERFTFLDVAQHP